MNPFGASSFLNYNLLKFHKIYNFWITQLTMNRNKSVQILDGEITDDYTIPRAWELLHISFDFNRVITKQCV